MTTTPTVRERFDSRFSNLSLYMRNQIWSFLEKEIAEAEARGEERGVKKGGEEMKQKCLAVIPEKVGGMADFFNKQLVAIRNSIQSL